MSINRQIIQIGGCVRSGTTLLGLILGTTPKAMSIGEAMHLVRPYTKEHQQVIERACKDERWQYIIREHRPGFYERVFTAFPECRLLIDSSKDPFWFAEQRNEKNNSNVSTIATFKSPAEIEQSFQKRGNHCWYKNYKNYYKRLLTIFPETRTINTDTFLSCESDLKMICDHVGVDHSNCTTQYWNTKQPNFFGSSTVNTKQIIKRQQRPPLDYNTALSNRTQKQIIDTYNELLRRNITNPKYEQTTPLITTYTKAEMKLYKFKDYTNYRVRHFFSALSNNFELLNVQLPPRK